MNSMNKKNICYLLLILIVGCAAPDFYSIEDVEKEKVKMEKGKKKSAETLLSVYKDIKQPYDVRLAALRSLEGSSDQFVIDAIRQSVSDGSLIELDMVNQSVNMLIEYNDTTSVSSLIEGLKISESKIMDVRENMINAISTIGSDDEVLTLVELYEVSKSNHHRMNELLTLTLGSIGDDKVIPILMEISTNEELSMNVRSQAIEILARKNSVELVDYFVKVLDDPNSNDRLNRYAHMMFEEFEDPRLMMSIVESYQVGKSEYYRLLNTLVAAMGNYDYKDVKFALLDIAKNKDNPHHIRIKSINSLGEIVDQNIVDSMLEMLSDPDNYKFYNQIISVIKSMDDENMDENLRKAAFEAMQYHKGN